LSLEESIKSSGKEFLESVIVGYEISIRIAEAINPSHRNKGFHTTGTVGTFGAGIACAKLLKLDVNKIMHTLGICGTQAAGLFEFVQNGSMIKRIHPGKSAWNGIVAAQLAQKGFTGPSTILEGKYGFLNATSDVYDISKLTQGLGESHRIMRVGIKRHAACRFSHTAIDTALELNSENNINIDNIYEIKIYASKQCVSQTGNYNIGSLLSAQFSTPYAVAVALVNGNANIDSYKSGLTNKEVILLMNKITLIESSNINDNSRQAVVHILMNDKNILEKKLMLPKGEPETPFKKSELEQKSIELYKGNLQAVKAKSLINYVNVLEKESNLKNIIKSIN